MTADQILSVLIAVGIIVSLAWVRHVDHKDRNSHQGRMAALARASRNG